MANVKKQDKPPTFKWRRVELGFHGIDNHNRIVAHIWPGSDKMWRGCIFNEQHEVTHSTKAYKDNNELCSAIEAHFLKLHQERTNG